MQIESIMREIDRGGVVGLPTETVFGLACTLDSKTGVEKLMRLKNRGIDSGKVFTLVPESVKNIPKYAILTEKSQKIIKKHLPGALTLILPKNPDFHHFYYDSFDSIGVRIPDFPLFDELLSKSGPLLLTSANLRGGTPVKDAAELAETMPEVDYIVDLPASNQSPSTIIDFTRDVPKVLRQGNLKIRL
ncbi:threonylcarbamoyl-AMP synthase [Candidatus Saccharibacteria bacterium]|nr:threonylcarbamoyl-AMP synthase [Candidatus Saccharibacteria bacterium]